MPSDAHADADQQSDQVRLAGRDPRDADAGDRRPQWPHHRGQPLGVRVHRPQRAIDPRQPVEECLIADPPEALQPEQHRSESSAPVEIRPADRTFDGSLWSGRVRYMEPGACSSVMVIALTKAAQEPFGPGALLEDARRFAEWIGGLQGLPWYRDERGGWSLPQEFPAPDRAVRRRTHSSFPLAYLLARRGSRARQCALPRFPARGSAVRRTHVFARHAGHAARGPRRLHVAPERRRRLAPVIGTIAAARPATARACRPSRWPTCCRDCRSSCGWSIPPGASCMRPATTRSAGAWWPKRARVPSGSRHSPSSPSPCPTVQEALQKALRWPAEL